MTSSDTMLSSGQDTAILFIRVYSLVKSTGELNMRGWFGNMSHGVGMIRVHHRIWAHTAM